MPWISTICRGPLSRMHNWFITSRPNRMLGRWETVTMNKINSLVFLMMELFFFCFSQINAVIVMAPCWCNIVYYDFVFCHEVECLHKPSQKRKVWFDSSKATFANENIDKVGRALWTSPIVAAHLNFTVLLESPLSHQSFRNIRKNSSSFLFGLLRKLRCPISQAVLLIFLIVPKE